MKKLFVLTASMLTIAVMSFVYSAEVVGEESKLFVVHSYDAENVCGVPQDEGLTNMLEKLGYREGKNIIISRFYMDTKRTYTTRDKMKMRGDMAIEKIKEFDPDVVVLLDDNAFRYVGLPLAKSKYPIVFCGMNGQIENYDKEVDVMISRQRPGYNITGVLETLRFTESFAVAKKIVPRARKVLYIGDYTPTGGAFARSLELELQAKGRLPLDVEIKKVRTFQEYKDLIMEANRRRDIDFVCSIVTGLDVEGRETRAVVPEIIAWTIKNLNKPDIGVTFFWVELGQVGGTTVDFPSMGGQVAVQVVRILKGEKPGDIPIEEASTLILAFNLARADQLGITIPLELIAAAPKVYRTMKMYPEYKME